MEGLVGIIKTGCVRATNAFYLNDASEIIHGLDIFDNCLEEKVSSAEIEMEKKHLKVGFVKKAFGDLPVYVFSLTRLNNDLSQWRAYGKEGGFAIEFDTKRLKRMKVRDLSPDRYGSLQQAIYDDKEKREFVQFAVDSLQAHERETDFDNAFATFCKNVLWGVSGFKNKAFESEKEFRLSFRLTSEEEVRCCDFDVRAGLWVPYCQIVPNGSDLLPIKSIWIGPRLDGARNKDSLKLLLQKHNYNPEEITISDSEIPLRST
jgi:hypothetical protein